MSKLNRTRDRLKCDDDSVLLLRLMYIIWLAHKSGSLTDYYLEHPEDPKDCSWAKKALICCSVWVTRAMIQWLLDTGGVLTKLDQ